MSATTSLLGKNCGRRQLCLNDLTDKMVPLKQEQLDVMFASGVNTIVNGLWGWDNLPPTVSGAARCSLDPHPLHDLEMPGRSRTGE